MSPLPSPLKSPVPTTDQVVGTSPRPTARGDRGAVHQPHRQVAAGVAPEQVILAVNVEVALSDDRPGGGHRAETQPEETVAPFISHIAKLPLVSRQRRSLLLWPLKSWVIFVSGPMPTQVLNVLLYSLWME